MVMGSKDIKCVVVGDGGVGKTSMLLSYTTGAFMTEYVPTVFDTFSVDMLVNDQECTVGLYDTAGQEAYDTLRTLVYYDTDIFVLCFSVARPDSFENVRSKWIPELKIYRPKARFILVGTQTDLRDEYMDAENTHQFVLRRQGTKLSLRIGAEGYYECSALTQAGVSNVFEKAAVAVLHPKRRLKLWRSFRSASRIWSRKKNKTAECEFGISERLTFITMQFNPVYSSQSSILQSNAIDKMTLK